MKIVTKYIVREVTFPLLFGIFGFASMFLGAALINLLGMAEQFHLSFWAVLKLLVLMIPQNLMWGTLMAVLLATLLGLGNLTGHSETIAMRAGGLSYTRLAAPVILLGLVVSIGGVLLNEYVIPVSLRAQERLQYQYINNAQSFTIDRFYRVFPENGITKAVFADRYDSGTQRLQNVIILEIEQGKMVRSIQAEDMQWLKGTWTFGKVTLYQYEKNNFFPVEIKRAKFKYALGLTPGEIELSQEPPERKSISELSQYIHKYVTDQNERQKLLVELHTKLSMPFASLVFAILGTPLALKPQRRSNASGFGLCMLFILIYYLVFALGTQFGRSGAIPPILGAWLADLLLLGYGLYVFGKVKS